MQFWWPSFRQRLKHKFWWDVSHRSSALPCLLLTVICSKFSQTGQGMDLWFSLRRPGLWTCLFLWQIACSSQPYTLRILTRSWDTRTRLVRASMSSEEMEMAWMYRYSLNRERPKSCASGPWILGSYQLSNRTPTCLIGTAFILVGFAVDPLSTQCCCWNYHDRVRVGFRTW